MSTQRPRLRPLIIHERKNVDFERPPDLKGGHLSPDLQPNTPPTFTENSAQKVCKVGKYLLVDQVDSTGNIAIHKAIHCDTQEEFVCKVLPVDKYRDILAGYWRVDTNCYISTIEEIILGESKAYVFFTRHYGDLHSYVRRKRKLRESEAGRLFHQIAKAVSCCHENGIILRDLKLRKFVFTDAERKHLKLEGLEDACILDDMDDDTLADKHGCPAYVSPEILNTSKSYSGKAADVWSLGVMLYTMLIGRYPFHDVEPSALFNKIRRGQFNVPDSISSRAKCLIRNLLRHDPNHRLCSSDILKHPWFRPPPYLPPSSKHKSDVKGMDQLVPSVYFQDEPDLFV